MDPNTNIAAWMIAGGPRIDSARERNRAHVRALRELRVPTPITARLAAAAAAFRASGPAREPACCPTAA